MANAILVVATIGAVISSTAEPTGTVLLDRIWVGAATAVVTYAAGRARRWPTFWLAAVATLASVGTWWCASAIIALGVATASGFSRGRKRSTGAAVGAFSALALLHLPSVGPFGATAFISAVAVVPVLVSGYRRSSSRARSTARWTAVGLTTVLVLASVGFGVSALLARSDVDDAVDLARSGLDQISSGDQASGAATLRDATAAFGSASDKLDAPWALPARVVPGVAQHARALSTASTAGRDVTEAASEAASTAPYQDLRAGAGIVDLALVRSMQEPTRATRDVLIDAGARLEDVDSPWLLGPVATPIGTFRDEVAGAGRDAEIASHALDALPDILGGGDPRSYLVLFTNPSETRNFGGFTGSYGILTADDGHVSFDVSGSTGDLYESSGVDPSTVVLDQGDEFAQRYGRYQPTRFLQNLTVSPDLATTAELSRSIYGQITGTEVDGVIVVDPFAIAALLELTGPVDVEGLAQPLTATNAVEYLLHGQYLEGDADDPARRDRLEAAGRATFDALTERDLPGPRVLGSTLGPLVTSKHLQVHPFDPQARALMERLGASGPLVADATTDFLSVRTADAFSNKLDYFLHKHVSYSTTFDPSTQAVRSTVSITLRNDAPDDGLPNYILAGQPAGSGLSRGTTRVRVGVYSPLDWTGTRLDGSSISIEPQSELGLNVYSALVTIAPGESATLEYTLEGTIQTGDRYVLQVSPQPLVHPDTFTVRAASGSPDWAVDADQSNVTDGVFSSTTTLDHDERFVVKMTPR